MPSAMPPLQLDPCDHRFHWDPYPTYAALREHDPVHCNAALDLWFLSKWDDVYQAFRDFRIFINTGATSLGKVSTGKLPYPMFIFSDPPEHARAQSVHAADDAGGGAGRRSRTSARRRGSCCSGTRRAAASISSPTSAAICRWT